MIFDVLSAKRIIRKPVSLYDAWVQSIMIPLVEIAKDDIELFKYRYKDRWADKWGKDGEGFLLQINFGDLIPESLAEGARLVVQQPLDALRRRLRGWP